jgi:hypothetical protein
MTISNDYYKARENEILGLYLMKENQAMGDGSARRVQPGENLHGPFENKTNEELINSYSYLSMLCDAQAHVRVAIEGLKKGKEVLGECDELILLELDIEHILIKLKNIAVGRKDIIKQNG